MTTLGDRHRDWNGDRPWISRPYDRNRCYRPGYGSCGYTRCYTPSYAYFGGYYGYGYPYYDDYVRYDPPVIYQNYSTPTYIESTVAEPVSRSGSDYSTYLDEFDAQATGPSGTKQEAPEERPAEPAALDHANAMFAEGRYGEAREAYLRVILTDSRDGYAKLLYGLSEFALHNFDTSAAAVRGALETTPDLVDDPVDLRGFYTDRSQFDAQLGTLLSYVNEPTDRKSPDQDRETRFLLAYFFFASAQPGQASDVLEDLVKEFPSDSQFVALRQAVRRIQETERRPAVTEP